MRKVRYLVVIAVGILIGCSVNTRNLDGYEARSVTVNGKTFGYRVFVPKDRTPGEKLPVMLYLHGSGTRGDDNVAQADAFSQAIEPVKDKVDFIVVLPQCREDKAWISDEMSNYALAALDDSVKEFNGDAERIYLAGFSLGAHGVWKIAGSNPGKFAALMPVAGRVVPYESTAASPYADVAKAIGSTPVWIFHGAKDEAVPVDFARKIAKELVDSGNPNTKYTEYADEGHLIFAKAFAEPGLLDWLAAQRNATSK